MAYSLSKLSGADPTLDSLRQMARACFKAVALPTSSRPPATATASPLVIYNAVSSAPTMDDDILSAYDTTPKTKGKFAGSTVRTPDNVKVTNTSRSPRATFSPASFSPSAGNVSAKYLQRTNAGDVVFSHGDTKGRSWRPADDCRLRPAIQPLAGAPPVPADARYMFQQMRDGAAVLDYSVDWLGSQLVTKHDLGHPTRLDSASPEQVWVVGRVCCDGTGRLNPCSVMLEGLRSLSSGVATPCNLRLLTRYSLFPGQVVALQATNHSGEQLLAHALHTDVTLPLPTIPPRLGPAEELELVVAAGPFTQMDTLGYQPLEDLVAYVRLHRPHVLLLIGPFIDCNHGLVADGSLAQTFQSFFDKLLDGILEPLAESGTQVVLVPSPRDAHHHAVYPCPPYSLRRQYAGVHLASDPCVLDVQGVVVAATSVDTLLHLGKEEISMPAQSGDRLGRLASHVLAQQSFYPLYPSDESLSVDAELWEQHARLPVSPHLLLLPSDLRFFIKELSGCVVVNPERLAKGVVGGSFARLVVSVVEDHTSVSGEIVKI
ncbi:DNA polymerase alpha subunit B isoform X2 [Bacillus rossius redtenbacheri]